MKIISKYKDYYDSALGFGIEKDRFFYREEKEIEFANFSNNLNIEKYFNYLIKNEPQYNYYYLRNISKELNIKILDIKENLLFFCGKCYPFLVLNVEQKNLKIEKKHFYDFVSFENFLKENTNNNVVFDKLWFDNKEKFKNFFNLKVDDDYEIYHYLKSCYFILSYNNSMFGINIKNYKITVYPELKSIGFQKNKNSYECLQEISQFLFGVLTSNENKTIEIDDKYKIEGHGFDLKESFRKRKKKE